MIPEDYRRPCYFKGRRAMFHRWTEYKNVVPPSPLAGGHCGGNISVLYGLIETEDGKCKLVLPENIQFADGGGFGDCVFLSNGGEDNEQRKIKQRKIIRKTDERTMD